MIALFTHLRRVISAWWEWVVELVLTAPWFLYRDGSESRGPVVLCELHKMRSIHLVYFFFLRALRLNLGTFRLIGFTSRGVSVRVERWASFAKLRNLGAFKGVWAYRAMGMKEYYPAERIAPLSRSQAEQTARTFFQQPSHEKLENLCVNGVIVGDLIYDEYLRTRLVPTVDFDSQDFKDFLLQSLTLVFNWFGFFSRNHVISVISTDVYLQSVPARIGHSYGIDSFVVDSTSTFTYRLSSSRPRTRDQYRDYPTLFRKLGRVDQKLALEKAEDSIQNRLVRGNSDPLVNNKSAWTDNYVSRQIEVHDGLNILIAAHDFSDSPHSAFHFYPDFFIWLEKLGEFAQSSRHKWYVKTHSDASSETVLAVNELATRFPKLQLVDKDSSHKQLIREGVSLALTVLGTIGIEYASQGLPVINATKHHTHMAYGFNINPQSRREYEAILRGLEDLDHVSHRINKSQVLEYIFMHRFYNRKSLVYSWPFVTEKLSRHTTYLVRSPKSVKDVITSVFARFIQSGDYWMDLENVALVNRAEWELLVQFQIQHAPRRKLAPQK